MYAFLVKLPKRENKPNVQIKMQFKIATVVAVVAVVVILVTTHE
jgi:hypothetical protein